VEANVKDGIEDTGPRMTRRTLLAAAPLAAAPFKSSLENSNSRWDGPGGTAREVNTSNFAISKSIAGVSMRLQPGALRELHWHGIAAEWAYIITGHVMTTVVSPDGTVEKNEFGPGDTWFFPRGYGHALQGLGPGECHFLLGFDNGDFSEFGTFSITDWISRTPRRIVERNLQLPESVVAGLPKREVCLEPGSLREMRWHPSSDEWQYYTKGRARVGMFGAHGRVETAEFAPGDVCFIPQGFGHWIEQLGGDATQLAILFNNPHYEEISLSQWLASNPASLLADNFGVTSEVIDKLPKAALGIAK